MLLSACATQAPPSRNPPTLSATPVREPMPTQAPRTATQQQLINEANALAPLTASALGKRFLRAAEALPAISARTAFRDDNTRDFFSPAEANALPEERRKKLSVIELDEYRYYYTKYGSPLAYVRALDLAAANGLTDVKGMRILDFGYGSALATIMFVVSVIATSGYLKYTQRSAGRD